MAMTEDWSGQEKKSDFGSTDRKSDIDDNVKIRHD